MITAASPEMGFQHRLTLGVLWLAVVSPAGCGGPQSAGQRLDRAMKQAGIQKSAVFPLAGRVLVDGQSPTGNGTVLIMLNDREKDDEPPAPGRFTTCDSDGSFVFSTYKRDDGVAEGNYIVTLAQLKQKRDRGFVGPDQFENLYSDPDSSDLKIEHMAPGRTDYLFEVQVAGRDPVNNTGPRAVTRLLVQQNGKSR